MADGAETAYPLEWPDGQTRTKFRMTARFATRGRAEHQRPRPLTVADALDRIEEELKRLNAGNPIISSNLTLRLDDGAPRSNQQEPTDSGVAVYFTRKGERLVFACDKWNRTADNIGAIAAHIAALRGQERWGVGTMDQAFRGYRKLPAPGGHAKRTWRQVFMINNGDTVSFDAIRDIFRALAKEAHPDQGGDNAAMAELSQAYAEAKKELGETQNG